MTCSARYAPMRAAYAAQVTELLRRHPSPSTLAIAEAIGVTRKAMYHRLVAMESDGLVLCNRSGPNIRWRLP